VTAADRVPPLSTKIASLRQPAAEGLLLSDLHVPSDGGDVVAMLQRALDYAVAERLHVFLLGDLFDSYVCRAQARTGIWRDVAMRLRAVVDRGVGVDLLHGNRDFLLGDEFAGPSGVTVHSGGLRGSIGGVDTLLLHGDELCWNDLPYQRAKRWLRQPFVRGLARVLPLRLGLWVAERARHKSQRVTKSGDPARFAPTVGAMTAAMAGGAERLVFGHIHQHAHGRFGSGEYWILPAFDATGIGLRLVAGRVEPFAFVMPPPTSSAVPGPFAFAG
jgi:UDP-2,3-diacylglucosamine hydrolase